MNSDWNVWKVWLAQKIFAIHVRGSWHPYEYHMNMIYGTCNLPSTQCELDLINTNLLYAVYSLLFLFILILDMKTWCKLFVNYIKYWVNFLKTPTQSNFIVYSDGFPLECFFFCSKDTKNYTVQPVPGSLPALTHPTAGAFVNFDGNLAAGMEWKRSSVTINLISWILMSHIQWVCLSELDIPTTIYFNITEQNTTINCKGFFSVQSSFKK